MPNDVNITHEPTNPTVPPAVIGGGGSEEESAGPEETGDSTPPNNSLNITHEPTDPTPPPPSGSARRMLRMLFGTETIPGEEAAQLNSALETEDVKAFFDEKEYPEEESVKEAAPKKKSLKSTINLKAQALEQDIVEGVQNIYEVLEDKFSSMFETVKNINLFDMDSEDEDMIQENVKEYKEGGQVKEAIFAPF